MKTLNKTYRCIMPCSDKGVVKSGINSNNVATLDHDTAVIYCWSGKVAINKEDRKTMVAYIFGSNIFNKIHEAMTDKNIEIIDSYLLDGEGFIKFRRVDIEQVAKICRAKPQRKSQIIGISNFKENYPYWLRIMKNVSSKYKDDLDGWKNSRKS